jgi:hypothetical protein
VRAAWHIDKKRAVRVAAPLVVSALVAFATGGDLSESAALAPLAGLITALAFTAGLLGGWLGAAGAAVGVAIGCSLAAAGSPQALLAGLGCGLAATVAAAVPFAVFRQVRGIGRGLPNLSSYLWLLAAGVLASLLGAAVRRGAVAGGSILVLWAGAAAGVVAVAFVAPLAALAVDLWGRRWMAPIPGEVPARQSLAVSEHRVQSAAGGEETRLLVAPRLRLGWGAGLGFAALLAITAVAVPVAEVLPEGGSWILLAYLVPVLWAASQFGMRGAVAAASAAGLLFAAGHAVWAALVDDPSLTLSGAGFGSACAYLVAFGLVGAVSGVAREREELLRVEVVHRNRLLRQDLLRVVQALTNAVEAKDVYTEGHLKRVSDFAVMVAEGMGLGGHELEMVFFASMLHDIGKIGIPEAILTKEGPLTLEERRVMQRHAEIGARILQDLDILRDAAPVVLHHQERWDGRRDGKYPGYPAGLRGEAIPLGSRVIAVVDAFDAMTTDRPYRKALAVAEALAELEKEAGRQFDPKVVALFARLLAEHPWKAEQVA